jgi:hypothetical protein
MLKMNTKKERQQSRKTSVANEGNALLISSKMMADLKNKGILVFKEMNADEQKAAWNWSKEVIQQYRSELESDPSNIRNIDELPFPKEDIKLAIKLAIPLYISRDLQSMLKMLKRAYKEIGTFQLLNEGDQKELRSEIDSKRMTRSQSNKSTDPLSDKYTERAISEKKALLQEINNYVNDLEALR